MEHEKSSLILVILLVTSIILVAVSPVSALDTLYEQDTTGGGSGGWYAPDNAIVFKATSTHTVTAGAIYNTGSAQACSGYFYLREVDTSTGNPKGSNLGGTASFSWGSGSGWRTSDTAYMGTVIKDQVYALCLHVSTGSLNSYNHYPTAAYGYRYSSDGGTTWAGTYTWDWEYKVYGTTATVGFSPIDETSIIKSQSTTLYGNATANGLTVSGFLHSIDYGNGTFYNTTWTAFGSAPYWANYTFTISGAVGTTINWKIYVNVTSGGTWYVSTTQSFTVNTRLTFYFNTGGTLYRNSSQVTNGTTVDFSSAQGVRLLAAANNSYTFMNFSYSGEIAGLSTDNPFDFNASNTETVWCYFANASGGGGAKYIEAFFIWSPASPINDTYVSFDASGSLSSSAITDYTWDFGDGNTTSGSNDDILHVFSLVGNYTVTLTVTSADGTDSVSHIVSVVAQLEQRSYGVAVIFLVVGIILGLMFLLFALKKASQRSSGGSGGIQYASSFEALLKCYISSHAK